MKKILALVLLILFVCSACFARQAVDPGRWTKLGTNDGYVYYIDNTSVKFVKAPYGTAADVWIMAEHLKDKARHRANVELNMDTNEIRNIGVYSYNKRDRLVSSDTQTEEFRAINENSYEEALFKHMQEYHETLKKYNYQIPEK